MTAPQNLIRNDVSEFKFLASSKKRVTFERLRYFHVPTNLAGKLLQRAEKLHLRGENYPATTALTEVGENTNTSIVTP